MTLEPVGMPRRGPGCPPAFALESLAAGEPAPAAVTSHAASCGECRAYLAELTRGQEAFLAQRPPELFLKKLSRARAAPASGRSGWAFVGALAAAACALLITTRAPSPDGVAWKGAGFAAFVKRAPSESPARLLPDARLRAGDQLRFAYASALPGYLAVFDLDGTGRVSVFHPFGATAPGLVQPSADGLLPGTVALDAAPGAEWLVAVYARSSFDLEAISRQLAATPRGQAPAAACDGCRVSALRFEKEP